MLWSISIFFVSWSYISFTKAEPMEPKVVDFLMLARIVRLDMDAYSPNTPKVPRKT